MDVICDIFCLKLTAQFSFPSLCLLLSSYFYFAWSMCLWNDLHLFSAFVATSLQLKVCWKAATSTCRKWPFVEALMAVSWPVIWSDSTQNSTRPVWLATLSSTWPPWLAAQTYQTGRSCHAHSHTFAHICLCIFLGNSYATAWLWHCDTPSIQLRQLEVRMGNKAKDIETLLGTGPVIANPIT